MKAYIRLAVFALAAFSIGLFFGDEFGLSGIENGTITVSVANAIFLLLAVVSITIGIISIIFSWLFYSNSQALNQDSSRILGANMPLGTEVTTSEPTITAMVV